MRFHFVGERMRRGFGVDRVLDQWARFAVARGHEAHVWVVFKDEDLPPSPYTLHILPAGLNRGGPYYDLKVIRRSRVMGRLSGDDLLLLTDPLLSVGLRFPSFMVGDMGLSPACGSWAKVRRSLLLPRAKRVFTISKFLRKQLPHAVQKNGEVLYLGADHLHPPTLPSHQLLTSFPPRDDKLRVLYVGRGDPSMGSYKGVENLLAWYQEAKEHIHLVMVGPCGVEGAKRLRQLGIFHLPYAPDDWLGWMMKETELLVSFSTWEGFNLPLMEAQVLGTPVAALNVGAHPEVVLDGETGWLEEDAASLGKRILSLATDRKPLKEAGEAAMDWGARFSWERWGPRWLEAMEEAVR
ncbi:glycosyltransferase family 4 protein [bacterium]|nr:glycosyltransferase family 4 protein [bacterium]